jgi:DNA modification methylase
MPIEVMENIIKLLPKDKIIVDPFSWSGTTALACKNLWRNFIGIDISQEYVDIANKRLENTTVSLF